MSRYYEPCPVCHEEEAIEITVRGVGRTALESEITDRTCGCVLTSEQENRVEDEAFERALCGE